MNKLLKIKIHTLFFIILIFMPKINLISFENFYQGIRVEDVIILFYFFYILSSYLNSKIIIWNKFFHFKYWLIILYFFSLSILFALINDVKNYWIMIPRAAEYAILIIFINNHSEKIEAYIKIFKSYIILNFIIVILQNNNLIGSFSSLGYLESNNILNLRSYGISGGSWEIGVLINLAYLILIHSLKNKYQIIFFYLLSATIIILANGRANIFAFIIISIYLFFYKKEFLKFRYFLKYLFLLLATCTVIIYLYMLDNYFIKNYFNIWNDFFNYYTKDIYFLIDSTYKLIINNTAPSFNEASSERVYSYIYRLIHWKNINDTFQMNTYHYIIGSGSPYIYTESIIVRIITSLGLFGTLIIIYSIKNLKLLLILIFLTMGLTLDLFASMKIFIFTLAIIKISYINRS